MPQTQFPTQNMNDIIEWTNAAAQSTAQTRTHHVSPQDTGCRDARFWRLASTATTGRKHGMLEEESTTWTLQRPFECDGQHFLVRYPTEEIFLRDDCIYQG